MNADSIPIFPFNRSRKALAGPVVLRAQRRDQGAIAPKAPVAEQRPPHNVARSSSPIDIQTDAGRFLRGSGNGKAFDFHDPEWLGRTGLNVRKASDAQHIQAIAIAYAASVQIAASPHRSTLIAEIETMSGRKRSRTTTDVHLIVERFISYGGESAAERLAARKLISRDVRAIQHLQAKKVLPSEVATLAASRGQGLHAWARQNAALKRTRVRHEDPKEQAQREQAEARQRTLIHEFKITTRRSDGTRVREKKLAITGISRAEITGLVQRLTRLADQGQQDAATSLR